MTNLPARLLCGPAPIPFVSGLPLVSFPANSPQRKSHVRTPKYTKLRQRYTHNPLKNHQKTPNYAKGTTSLIFSAPWSIVAAGVLPVRLGPCRSAGHPARRDGSRYVKVCQSKKGAPTLVTHTPSPSDERHLLAGIQRAGAIKNRFQPMNSALLQPEIQFQSMFTGISQPLAPLLRVVLHPETHFRPMFMRFVACCGLSGGMPPPSPPKNRTPCHLAHPVLEASALIHSPAPGLRPPP